jgi:hypothetical protein
MEQIYPTYWLLFTKTGELAVDDCGPAILDHYSENWIKNWNSANPKDAPHIAVEYKPNIV